MPDAWPQRQLDALLAEGAIGYQRCEACTAAIHYETDSPVACGEHLSDEQYAAARP
jgi:hypothetical protein